MRHRQPDGRAARTPGYSQRSRHRRSSAYVAAAQKRYASPCATFGVGDACAIAAPDKSFDHALSLLVLQFALQAERAITEM
ncbi:methyltransferase domain-containing protein [uncultured Bosea sp.]|uniref:methyltransferase domain-containing protein n=1 Tax=uncultured Bosea sp. TaxID=211457 RepID=UPI00345C136A